MTASFRDLWTIEGCLTTRGPLHLGTGDWNARPGLARTDGGGHAGGAGSDHDDVTITHGAAA